MVFSRDTKNRVSGPTGCATTRPALTPSTEEHSMSTATLVHTPAAPAPQTRPHRLDPRDLARRLRHGPAAWSASAPPRHRRGADLVLRPRLPPLRRHAAADRPAAGWVVVRPAPRQQGGDRHPRGAGAPGHADPLRPAASRRPRGGWSWAWTHDPLAAANLNRSYRVHLARQRRREVARAMAQDRAAMAAGPSRSASP